MDALKLHRHPGLEPGPIHPPQGRRQTTSARATAEWIPAQGRDDEGGVSATPLHLIVMVGLGPTIHEFACNRLSAARRNSWMPGPSPGMTNGVLMKSQYKKAGDLCRR